MQVNAFTAAFDHSSVFVKECSVPNQSLLSFSVEVRESRASDNWLKPELAAKKAASAIMVRGIKSVYVLGNASAEALRELTDAEEQALNLTQRWKTRRL